MLEQPGTAMHDILSARIATRPLRKAIQFKENISPSAGFFIYNHHSLSPILPIPKIVNVNVS